MANLTADQQAIQDLQTRVHALEQRAGSAVAQHSPVATGSTPPKTGPGSYPGGQRKGAPPAPNVTAKK